MNSNSVIVSLTFPVALQNGEFSDLSHEEVHPHFWVPRHTGEQTRKIRVSSAITLFSDKLQGLRVIAMELKHVVKHHTTQLD
jgi:hypothetical protein